jgi:hypothetical protein
MKSIKEKSEEYVDDYYHKLGISKDEYPTDVVISKADFIAGANYVLEQLEEFLNLYGVYCMSSSARGYLKFMVGQLKSNQ